MADADWTSRIVFDIRLKELRRDTITYFHHSKNVGSTFSIWDVPSPPQPEPNSVPGGDQPGPEVPQKATLRLMGTVPMEL